MVLFAVIDIIGNIPETSEVVPNPSVSAVPTHSVTASVAPLLVAPSVRINQRLKRRRQVNRSQTAMSASQTQQSYQYDPNLLNDATQQTSDEESDNNRDHSSDEDWTPEEATEEPTEEFESNSESD